jgi:hypothetical protein
MMRHASRSILTGLLAALAFALLAVQAGGTPVAAQADGPTFAIDAGPRGNEATKLGRIEDCVEVARGDRFQVDLVVQDITDLLAWEIPIDYDPDVVIVVGQDVKLFQQANEGSSVLDLSARLPDDTGFHTLAAVDSADPDAPDSGSGVLARITLEAVGAGESPIRFGNRDADSDGNIDRASLIRNADTEIIGDDDGDTFFDGEQVDALVVVDGDCPSGATVAEAATVDEPAGPVNSNGSTPWPLIGGGIAAGVAALLALAFLLTRRRSRPAA